MNAALCAGRVLGFGSGAVRRCGIVLRALSRERWNCFSMPGSPLSRATLACRNASFVILKPNVALLICVANAQLDGNSES